MSFILVLCTTSPNGTASYFAEIYTISIYFYNFLHISPVLAFLAYLHTTEPQDTAAQAIPDPSIGRR